MADYSRRDVMGAAAAAAGATLAAGAARAQTANSSSGGTSSDSATPADAATPERRLGDGMTQVPGDPIPNRLVGRPRPATFTPPAPPSERLGWAVAGLGDFAVNHMIPAMDRAQHSRLAGLVSGNADKAAAVARALGIESRHVYSYESFDEIADDEAIQVVYIVTPNGLHRDLAVRALDAGKHVLCEKPMANSVAECEAMIAAAKRADRLLMIAYRAHFEPHNLAAKTMMTGGALGAVNFIDAYTHRPLDISRPRDQWRIRRELAGGGSMPDIGIYALNGAIFYYGETPESLTAQVHAPDGDPRFAEIEDVCAVQARFPSGAVAHMSSSYTTGANRISIFGDKAFATLSPATSYHDNRLSVHEGGQVRQITTPEQSDVQFFREMDHLSLAIKSGTGVLTPGEMGLRDVALIEAIYHAALTGERVEVDETGRMKG